MPGLGGGGGGAGAVRAGRAYVELFTEDNQVYRALDRLKRRFESFGGLAIRAGGALGAAGAVALAPLKPLVDALQEQAKLGAVADAFGLSAEKASRLFGIMKAGGSDLRDATEGVVTFNQRIDDAISGKGEEAADLFKDLGRAANTFTGDSADKFYQLLDALRQVPDPAKRVQLLLKAVGEDTGKNLIPLLSLSADRVQELGSAFEQSAGDIKQARESSFAYTIAVARVGAVWREVVNAVAPAAAEVAEWVGRTVRPAIELVRQNQDLVVTVFAVAGGLVAAGTALAAFGVAVQAAGVAISATVLLVKGLALAVTLLANPIGLAAVAVAALGYVLLTETEAGQEALDELGAVFRRIGQTFTQTWTGVVDAVKAGDLELAFKVTGAGIKVVWYELLASLKGAWNDFLNETVGALRSNPVVGKALVDATKNLFGPAFPLLAAFGFDPTAEQVAGGLKSDTAAALAKLNAAKAELAALTAEARAKALAPPPPAAVTGSPGRAAQAALYAGSLGSFTAVAAAQQFGGQRMVQKKLGDIADNTAETVKAIIDLARGFTFK